VRDDPHGIRIRLVRSLRKSGALQLQRSAWLVERFTEETLRLVNEYREAGGSIKISEWLQRNLSEVYPKGKERLKIIAAVPMGAEPISEGWDKRVRKLLEGMGHRIITVPMGESAWSEFYRRERPVRRYKEGWSKGKSVSRALDEIALKDIDGIVLINSGRSSQSGMLYGAQTLANTVVTKGMTSLPIIQVERAGRGDGVVLVWNGSGAILGKRIAGDLGMAVIKPSLQAKIVTMEGGREVRQIHYARLGDEIIVNGHAIGVCLSDQVFLIAEKGILVDIMGGKMRKREAQKIRFGSILDLIVKTVSRA